MVIFSPHRGYSPFNDLKCWDQVRENISRVSEGNFDLINIVRLENEY